MSETYIENNYETISDMTGTYKTCFICNLVSSTIFAFYATVGMINQGFSYFANYPLAGFSVIFGCLAVMSYLKYKALKA